MLGTLRDHPTLCVSSIRVTQACSWRLNMTEWMWVSEGQRQLWLHTSRTMVPTYLGGCAMLMQSPPDRYLGTTGCACPCCTPRMGL